MRHSALSVLLGPLLVALGYGLILGIACVHFTKFLPARSPWDAAASVFLASELLLQYSLAIWSDPGYVVSRHLAPSDGCERGSGQPRVCQHCKTPKPPRAHHCRECRRCVYEMDHHCPWLNNCVGYYNYRHFWLLLLYIWVSCLYVATLSARLFVETFTTSSADAQAEGRDDNIVLDRFKVLFSFMATTVVGVVVCGYWGWHVYLVLTEQSTIEFMQRDGERLRLSVVSAASVRHALARMLGRQDALWFTAFILPPLGRRLPPNPSTEAQMREGDMQRRVMYVDLVKGRNASVNVGMHEDVGKLLGEIAEQMKYKTLFRAVAAQVGSRLTVTSAQLWQIRRGVVPFEVFRMVENGVELRPGTTLSRYNFPRNEDMQDEEVHLLVLTLEQPRVQPTWKPDEPLIHSLDEGRLAFTNRDAAVKTLQDVHAWNATGKNWKVPLADNDHGFGKTEFALHYVDQCKKTLLSHSANITSRHREVLTELSNCRTILIDGEPGQFVGKAPPNEVMNRALAEAITVKLEPGTAPSMTFTDSAKTFMSRIVKDLGPLFIVFDDIGPAFEDFTGQSVDSRELFFRFCKCVLAPWMATPKVYFLLLSQASFSRTIEWTPHEDEYMTAKPYDFARLPFSLFGRNHVEAILEETQVSRDDKRTLRGRWELTSRSSVDEAVKLLVTASSGHPRTLLDMLIENPTFDDFRQYVDKGADFVLTTEERTELYRNVLLWQHRLLKWVGGNAWENPMVDLTLDVQTRDGEDVSPILVLRQCHLSWEGTLEQARIFTHGVVWNGVLSVLRPLRDYITSIDKLQAFGALDPANLLKWAIVKRFQLLLSGKVTMRKALPSFFGKTRVFDDFEGEWLPTEVDPLPAIQRYGKGKGPANVGFWLKTARSDAWPKLMDIIVHDLADECRCLCLMPQAKSWSVDVLFMTHASVSTKRMGAAAKRQKQEARMQTVALGSSNLHILTLGLSVRPIAIGTADIIEECKKFEAMFCNLGEVEDKFGNMTNVLVICATKYSSEVQQSFLRRASTRYIVPTTIRCPHITEVLLLDLTTERMRQEFMGLENEPGLTRAMERMVVAACLATSSNK